MIVFILWLPSLIFYEFLWEAKRSAIFHARVIARRKAWFCWCTSRIIICSEIQLDDIAHEGTIICRKLFTDHMVGFRPMKRKKNLHQMMIVIPNSGQCTTILHFFFSSPCKKVNNSVQKFCPKVFIWLVVPQDVFFWKLELIGLIWYFLFINC